MSTDQVSLFVSERRLHRLHVRTLLVGELLATLESLRELQLLLVHELARLLALATHRLLHRSELLLELLALLDLLLLELAHLAAETLLEAQTLLRAELVDGLAPLAVLHRLVLARVLLLRVRVAEDEVVTEDDAIAGVQLGRLRDDVTVDEGLRLVEGLDHDLALLVGDERVLGEDVETGEVDVLRHIRVLATDAGDAGLEHVDDALG